MLALGCLFTGTKNNSDDQISLIEKRLNTLVEGVNEEAQLILKEPDYSTWSSLQYSFFLLDSTEVLAWSRNQFLPDLRLVNDSTSFRLSRSNAGDFLIRRWIISDTRSLLALIPLVRRYPISNRYLFPEWNDEVFDGIRGTVSDVISASGPGIKLDGQEVFRFQIEVVNLKNGYFSFALACGSILSFLFGIYFLARNLHQARRYELTFFLLATAIVFVRVVMVSFDFPVYWITSSVFDPQHFASSEYNSSIGDLLLNSIGVMILCGYVFFTYYHWKFVKWVLQSSGWVRYSLGCFFITLAFFSFLYPFLFIETIFHNSTISLDITQSILFDWLRSLSWLSVLAGGVSAFFFVHTLINLSKSLLSKWFHFLLAMGLAGVIFGTYFLVASRDYTITLTIASVFFLLLFITNLTSSLGKMESITFIYFFVVIVALGVQHGLSVRHFEEEKRAESQFKFASDYLIGHDVLGEYLLNENAKRIRKDAFIQSRLNNPFLTKSAIRQKIKQVYLNSYFDRYDAQIYLYNSDGEPLDNNSPETLATFSSRFQDVSNATEYEGVYFIQPSDIDSNKRYLSLISIYRADQIIGFVVIDLSLKRIIPQNVYPELLVDRRFAEFFENTDRSFSFIKDNRIISSFGTFNYQRDFDFSILNDPYLYRSGINVNGYFHTGQEDSAGRVAVITSSAYPIFYVLTNFSFFFVWSVIALVITMVVYGLLSIIRGLKMNYAARIQLYIYLAFSLPLFVATITTLNRVSKSAEDELNRDFEADAQNLSEGLLSSVIDYMGGAITKEDFETILVDRSKLTNSDITLYDHLGRYVGSSQPLIIESQVMSSLMNRSVLERITSEGINSIIVDERIGSLQFNNCYVTIKSPETGNIIGILSVPFFDSANSLEDTQVNVLSNFLTVFTIIFILFSILSFYVVNSLTFPLRFITRILSRTTLSGSNQRLEWKSNDEIGMMVSEYNRMVNNLEQSKIELARSQKESAWREIAKQVAHEIKNPLTPMKLTLQHMEYQLKRNELDNEKARTSINTLLTQVDILNDIASSFSAFARMPAPILARIDLVSLLNKSVDLFSDFEGGKVMFNTTTGTAFVMGDEQLFNRIFSNVILNALQSGHGERIVVMVTLDSDGDFYLIKIRDNGRGIAPEMIDKVFIPYFSTKQSGSGLGLAISKQGIEQSGGQIWFDTEPGLGTTFYIKLLKVD